jgi:hypothetical protein
VRIGVSPPVRMGANGVKSSHFVLQLTGKKERV